MLCTVRTTMVSGRRKHRELSEEVATNHAADESVVSTSVEWIPKQYRSLLTTVRSRILAAHHMYTLPWADDGSRILTCDLFDQHAEAMRGLDADVKKAAQEFFDALPAIKAESLRKLGNIQAEGFYWPTSADECLTMQVKYLPLPQGGDFRVRLSKDEVDLIRDQIEEDVRSTVDEAVKTIRTRAIGVVSDFIDRVSNYRVVHDPSKKGGKRVENTFRDSVVTNMRDLVRLIPGLNVTDDPDIHNIAIDLQERLCDFDADTLRNNDQKRKETVESAREILGRLKS